MQHCEDLAMIRPYKRNMHVYSVSKALPLINYRINSLRKTEESYLPTHINYFFILSPNMATSNRPTLVFFPGAFAEPSCFDRLVPHFQKAGYPSVYARIPSLNPSDPASISTNNDASETRKNVLLPLIEEQHKDVIIFTHSYGGVVGGAAAAGLSKASRASRNEAGGVVGLVYLVGNIVSEGETLLQAIGGAYSPFIKEGNVSSIPPY